MCVRRSQEKEKERETYLYSIWVDPVLFSCVKGMRDVKEGHGGIE